MKNRQFGIVVLRISRGLDELETKMRIARKR